MTVRIVDQEISDMLKSIRANTTRIEFELWDLEGDSITDIKRELIMAQTKLEAISFVRD